MASIHILGGVGEMTADKFSLHCTASPAPTGAACYSYVLVATWITAVQQQVQENTSCH